MACSRQDSLELQRRPVNRQQQPCRCCSCLRKHSLTHHTFLLLPALNVGVPLGRVAPCRSLAAALSVAPTLLTLAYNDGIAWGSGSLVRRTGRWSQSRKQTPASQAAEKSGSGAAESDVSRRWLEAGFTLVTLMQQHHSRRHSLLEPPPPSSKERMPTPCAPPSLA